MIRVRGARENNLRGIDCDLRRGALIVVTGPSGSGKSSLVFDTLAREAHFRYEHAFLTLKERRFGKLRRPAVDELTGLAFVSSLRSPPRGGAMFTVARFLDIHDTLASLYFRLGALRCIECGAPVGRRAPEAIVRDICAMDAEYVVVSAPLGDMARDELATLAEGLAERGFTKIEIDGVTHRLDALRVKELPAQRTLAAALVIDAISLRRAAESRVAEALEIAAAESDRMAVTYANGQRAVYSFSRSCAVCGAAQPPLRQVSFAFYRRGLSCPLCQGSGNAEESAHGSLPRACPMCLGSRLRPEAGRTVLAGLELREVLTNPIDSIAPWAANELPSAIAEQRQVMGADATNLLLAGAAQIAERCRLVVEVGAGYLALSRAVRTLSTGEHQRLALAGQIGAALHGIVVALDEPTSGLHPLDVQQFLSVIKAVVHDGNTAIVVEHDPACIAASDYLLALGPGGGPEGGQILYAGPPSTSPKSSGEVVTTPRGPAREWLTLSGVTRNNLISLDVAIPLQRLVGVCGVSGSGKSSLISDALAPVLHRLLNAQGTDGDALVEHGIRSIQGWERLERLMFTRSRAGTRGVRSIVASSLGVLATLRDLYSQTIGARAHGYDSRHFSFNLPEGRCPRCEGRGYQTVVSDELPLECGLCGGRRLHPRTEAVRYRGHSLSSVLQLTISNALALFRAIPNISGPLAEAELLGLGYLTLGQPVSRLSRGEQQRLRLIHKIGETTPRRTIYLLDEPSSGLGAGELERLARVLQARVEKGQSVVMVEHNAQLLRACDYLVELGPGAGEAGGRIIAAGTPAEVSANPDSRIAPFLGATGGD